MKAKFILIFLFLFASGYLNTALAQNPNEIIKISPLIFNIELSPGKTYHYKLTIENLTKAPLPVRASLENFATTDEEGGYNFQNNKPNPLLSWIKLSQNEMLLPARSKQTINVTVSIPQKVSLGGYYGILFLEPLVSQKTINGNLISAKVGTLFLANIGVTAKDTKAEVLTLNLPLITENHSLPLLLRVQNNGLNHFSAKPTLELKPLFGKKETIDIEEKFVFPGKVRRWEQDLSLKNKWRGIYKATLRVSTGEGKYIEKSSYVISFPVSKVLLIFFIITICIFILTRKQRVSKAIRILLKGSSK